MAPIKLKIKCRIEEVPVIGSFLIKTMSDAIADFTAYSPDYTPAYVTQALADVTAIEALINPKQLTAELKVITTRIYTNQTSLRSKIDYLEGYINRVTTGLTIAKKDFGISDVRTKNNKGDIEGTATAISYLLANVNHPTNLPLIQAKGYTTAQNTALVTLKTNLKTDNIAQNTKINERNNKVIANYTLINTFWDKITEIADAGKRIYKATAPNKVDDYTMATLKKRVNQERTNTLIQGIITTGTTPINKAKIEMQPLTGGRRRTTTTKADGSYVITSITEGDYLTTFTATGKTPQTQTITIQHNTATTQNIDLQ